MAAKEQMRRVELQRRIKIAVDALQSVERYLARELQGEAGSRPDELAERIKNATKAGISKWRAPIRQINGLAMKTAQARKG